MRASRALGAVILSCLACACGDDTSQVTMLPYLDYCVGVAVGPCLQSEDGYFDYINGFQFEWGHDTELRILTRHIENPPADGSSLEYHLVDIERRTPVEPGTRFELAFGSWITSEDYARLVTGDCARGFELYPYSEEAKQFSVEDSSACESVEQLLSSQTEVELTFEFSTPEAPLKVVAFE